MKGLVRRALVLLEWSIVVPSVLLTSLVVLSLGTCTFVTTVGELADRTTLPGEIAGATLTLERRANSPIGLAEYRRLLRVHRGGREILRRELAQDHGGVVAVNAYLRPPTTVILVDRISGVAVDLARAIEQPLRWGCGMTRPDGDVQYHGSFGRVGPGEARHGLRFFSAAERPESGIAFAPEVC